MRENCGLSKHDAMIDSRRTGLRKCIPQKILRPLQKYNIECITAMTLVIIVLIAVIIGLSVALNVAKTSDKSAPCDDNWIQHLGKCYYFSNESETWSKSQKFCHSHNSSLAIIDSKEELDFLLRLRCSENHWIGIKRTYAGTGWSWTNGTSYNERLFRITRLSKNSGTDEYAFLNHDGVKSQEGVYEHKWICTRK